MQVMQHFILEKLRFFKMFLNYISASYVNSDILVSLYLNLNFHLEDYSVIC